MKLTSKTLKLAGLLGLALTTPVVLSTAASAAPMQQGSVHIAYHASANRYADNDYGYDRNKYKDRYHQPPRKAERIPTRPGLGYKFHPGHWKFTDHWVWDPGHWSRVLPGH